MLCTIHKLRPYNCRVVLFCCSQTFNEQLFLLCRFGIIFAPGELILVQFYSSSLPSLFIPIHPRFMLHASLPIRRNSIKRYARANKQELHWALLLLLPHRMLFLVIKINWLVSRNSILIAKNNVIFIFD